MSSVIWGTGCGASGASGAERAMLAGSLSGAKGRRVGWVTWPDADALIYCDAREDARGNPVGLPGPCARFEVGDSRPEALGDGVTLGPPDESSPTSGPDERCTFRSEPAFARGAPARLLVREPDGAKVVASWPTRDAPAAAAYLIEPTFAPEGRWMGLLYLAVTARGRERRVHVVGVDVRPSLACR